MNKHDFSTPQKESILATLFSAAQLLRILFNIFWPLIIFYFIKNDQNPISPYWIYGGIFVLLLLMALHGYLSWKNCYFYIKNNEFVLEQGYLRKSIVALPLEKIVSVNVNQKLLHQILGVVEVQIDSAGSKNKEVKIKAVTKSYAIALEEALSNANKKSNTAEEATEAAYKRTIVALSPLSLLKVSLGRNHLYGLLLLLAFLNQIQTQLRDLFENEVDNVINETTTTLEHSDSLIWLFLVSFVVVLSIVISIVRTYLFLFDLKLSQIKNSFLLECGLWKRKKVLVPFSRVQALRKENNPLQRLLKINSLQFVQASSKTQSKEADKILIQGCTDEQIDRIRKMLQKPSFENNITELPHWALRNRLFLLNSIFIILFLILGFFFHWVLIIAAILVLVVGIIAHWGYKRRKYILNKDLLHIVSGSIVHKEVFFELYKIQTIKISQTFFQRRRNTATLRLGLAGTEVTLAYLPYENAVKIKDFLLYKVITTKNDWM